MVKLKFLGATQTVTGSSYLITHDKGRFLVDCGMFQGIKDVDKNLEPFAFDPKSLDFVIITHAHIDHIGLLPKLIKQGFNGKIYLTNATSNIAYHLLLDAAKIQEIGFTEGQMPRLIAPGKLRGLYNTRDALGAIEKFVATPFDKEIEEKGVRFKFENVGHVLGAASIKIVVENKTIYFSGDIGRFKHPFLKTFSLDNKEADYVIMESLYGGKEHEDYENMIKKFIEQMLIIIRRGGDVMIPTFALQRTQEILYNLRIAYQENLIPYNIPVFLDSPLGIRLTNEYSHYYSGDKNVRFRFDQLRLVERSNRMIKTGGKSKIILAGSGMCDGGRILSHLVKRLPNEKNALFIVGFQAEGTLGRSIISRPKKIKIYNKLVKISADIFEFYGFSAHGDRKDLKKWLFRFDKEKLKTVFLVHSESEGAEAFKKYIDCSNCHIPNLMEEIILS